MPADPASTVDAAEWAEQVRSARRRIVDLVRAGVSLSTLPEAVSKHPDAGPIDLDVLASTRILTLCEARPGAGKVASRRALAGHEVAELAPYGAVPARVLSALDQTEPAS